MNEETQITKKPKAESHILNLSVRALVVLILVCTVCFMALKALKVEEPLYSLVFLAVGYYFGQGNKPKSQTVAAAFIACLMFVAGGCAQFKNKQTDTSYVTNGIPVRVITTEQVAKTVGPAKSDLTKFKATNTDKTQSASVGSLAQESEDSKLIELLILLMKAK